MPLIQFRRSGLAAMREERTCARGAVRTSVLAQPASRAMYHQGKRDEREGRNRSAEPKDFAVGDQDDGQVLEDRVDRDGEVLLRRFGSSAPRAAPR